jgi:hypothetical protein
MNNCYPSIRSVLLPIHPLDKAPLPSFYFAPSFTAGTFSFAAGASAFFF